MTYKEFLLQAAQLGIISITIGEDVIDEVKAEFATTFGIASDIKHGPLVVGQFANVVVYRDSQIKNNLVARPMNEDEMNDIAFKPLDENGKHFTPSGKGYVLDVIVRSRPQ